MTQAENSKIEEFKINLCSDYGLESYFQDILSYMMMKMKNVGILHRLEYDSFDKIEYNYIQSVSLIFYETSNVVLGEEYLSSISPSKAETIRNFPSVIDDFNSYKKTLTREIKSWNSANGLIDNENKFVFDVLHSAYSTTGKIIRNSKNIFKNHDNSVFGIAELPNYSMNGSGRGCLQIFLNVSGVLKKITDYGNYDIFVSDLDHCLKTTGFQILKEPKEFLLAETNKKTLNIIPARDTALIEESFDGIWYKKNTIVPESLRYNIGGTFLSNLVDNGIITLFFDSNRKVKI